MLPIDDVFTAAAVVASFAGGEQYVHELHVNTTTLVLEELTCLAGWAGSIWQKKISRAAVRSGEIEKIFENTSLRAAGCVGFRVVHQIWQDYLPYGICFTVPVIVIPGRWYLLLYYCCNWNTCIFLPPVGGFLLFSFGVFICLFAHALSPYEYIFPSLFFGSLFCLVYFIFIFILHCCKGNNQKRVYPVRFFSRTGTV